MADLLLPERQVELAACILEKALRAFKRDGGVPNNDELRQYAALLAGAVPSTVVKLPDLLSAAGPQVAAAVRAQVSGPAASVTASRPASLGCSEAARLAGVSGQAVRAACASGRLVATKHAVSGEWRIHPADLDGWMEARNAA